MNMRIKCLKRVAGCAAGAMLILPVAASAGLVVNGGFENTSGTYSDGGGGYMLVGVGSSTIPGWTVADQAIAWIYSGAPQHGLMGTEGSYFLDLTGIVNQPPFGGVLGTTISTVANNWYTLSFDVGRGNGEDANPVVVQAKAGAQTGTFIVSDPDPGAGKIAWKTFVLNFQATGPSTDIEISGTADNAGNGFIGLDRVTAVPEPTTMVAGAGALGLVLFGMARSKRSDVIRIGK